MKITIPVELDVNLTELEIIKYVRNWIIPLLRRYKSKGSDWSTSKPIIQDGKLFWRYQETCGEFQHEVQYEEIPIEDKEIFNLCKGAIEFLNAANELYKQGRLGE